MLTTITTVENELLIHRKETGRRNPTIKINDKKELLQLISSAKRLLNRIENPNRKV